MQMTIPYAIASVVLLCTLADPPGVRAASPATTRTAPTTAPATRPTSQPWTHLDFLDQPGSFQFAILADNAGGIRPGVFERGIQKLNLMRPAFVMSVGDLIRGYTRDPEELSGMWDSFQSAVAGLKMPFFYLVGNHDAYNRLSVDEWQRRFGKSYYHFVYRDVLFLCLNTEDPPSGLDASISPEQIRWLKNVLAENADVRWTFVFMHRPMWNSHPPPATAPTSAPATRPASMPAASAPVEDGWKEVEASLRADDRQFTVFAGHRHTYLKQVRDGRDFVELATTGGITETLPNDVRSNAMGVLTGRFDHFTWVTMTEAGPQIANVLLDGVWPDDIRTPESTPFATQLLRQPPVWLDPIMTQELKFSSATSKLHVVNDSDVTMYMQGTFERSAQLSVEPSTVYLELAPKSEQSVDVTISAELPAQVKVLLPLPLHWKVEYETSRGEPGRQDLKLQSVSRNAITPLLPLGKRVNAAILDGKLDDWDNLSNVINPPAQVLGDPRGYHGEADASARFAVQHDDNFLYVAAKVIDDQIVLDRSRVRRGNERFRGVEVETWPDLPEDFTRQLDGLEIIIDARSDPDRSLSRGALPLTNSAFIAVHPPTDEQSRPVIYRQNRLPKGSRVECRRDEGGYAVEVAIPLSYIIQRQSPAWSRVRVNVTVNDVDGEDESPVQLPWQPAWGDDLNVIGSGTFERTQ